MIFILFVANSHLQNDKNNLKDHTEHLNDIISYQNIQINHIKEKPRGLDLIFEDKELLFLSLMTNNIHKGDLLIDIYIYINRRKQQLANLGDSFSQINCKNICNNSFSRDLHFKLQVIGRR